MQVEYLDTFVISVFLKTGFTGLYVC